MANITSQKWLDLIFANKNKDFGAYQLRKKSAKRHNLAALFTLIGLIVIVGLVIGWSKYSAYRAELLAQAEAERMREAQAQAEQQEEMEDLEEELEKLIEEQIPEEIPEVEQQAETVQQTAISIVDEVQNPPRSMDEALESNTLVSTTTQEGNEDFDVDKFRDDTAPTAQEPPQVEEKKPEPKPEPEEIFQAVEQMAQFPGGQAALNKWLSNNLKYPESAQQNNVEGRVVVQFVVNKDGSIQDAKVVKGVDKDLDKEALRVVNKMPKWQPGKNNGVVVRSIFTLPVVFKLQTL